MTMTDQQTTTSNTQSEPVLCKHGCGFFVSTVYTEIITRMNDGMKKGKNKRRKKRAPARDFLKKYDVLFSLPWPLFPFHDVLSCIHSLQSLSNH
jgi:hypothetical protein